ncbi:helicase HerA domain-containing protein [Aureivirga sp. CE67]|uniref:TraG/VirB4 family ATPase n=1 Tax=Aureivirga sp. CE67 TaxID=1788983 RepID=UPI0018CA6E8D|nr:DUF87 domain-containing protein [Aureivirga sp. CE67]
MKNIFQHTNNPFLIFEYNSFLNSNLELNLVYEVDLPETYSLTSENIEEIHQIWIQAFKLLPINTIILKQDIFTERKYKANTKSKSFIENSEMNHFQKRKYFKQKTILHFCLKNTDYKSNQFLNPFKKITKFENYNHKQLKFKEEVEKCISFLVNSRFIEIKKLNEKDIKDNYTNYFNGLTNKLQTDIILENKDLKIENSIQIGSKIVTGYMINNLDQLPENLNIVCKDSKYSTDKYNFYKNIGDNFGLEIPFEHIYNQLIIIKDTRKEINKLEEKRKILEGLQALEPRNKNKIIEIEDYLEILENNPDRKIIDCHQNILFFSKNFDELRENSKIISNTFRTNNIKPKLINHERLKQIFLCFNSPYISHIPKQLTYTTELAVGTALFIINSNSKSDTTGIRFTERNFNIPIYKDIIDLKKKRIKASNFMIFGPTGEGKSVLAQHIFRQLIDQNHKIVIFDIGESFKNFSRIFPENTSQFITYKHGFSLGINPFELNNKTIDSDKIRELIAFINCLWLPNKILDEHTKSALEKLLIYYYKEDKEPNFIKFYYFVKSNGKNILNLEQIPLRFIDLDSFFVLCSKYLPNGIYHFLLEKTSTNSIQEEKKLMVFEFGEAKSDKNLLAILFQLALISVKKLIWDLRTEKGFIFFDEMAEFIKYDSIKNVISFYYQAIRKQNASIGVALQSPAQLPKTERIEAMIDNTQVVYVLFNEKGYEGIVQKFNLSNHQHNILRSIRPNLNAKNPYTEIGLIIGKFVWVVRLELSKTAYLAYQTEGEICMEIERLYQKNNSLKESITEYQKNNS